LETVDSSRDAGTLVILRNPARSARADNLHGAGTYTLGGTPTITAPTINGGALAGIFSGTPTFPGNLTFSGDPLFTGLSQRRGMDQRYADLPPAERGMPTWSFLQVLSLGALSPNYDARRALRALEDVGLLIIKLGPRGVMAMADFDWTNLAYLPKPTPRSVAMADDDERAIECLAAGIA
jgi:hypothetical protein